MKNLYYKNLALIITEYAALCILVLCMWRALEKLRYIVHDTWLKNQKSIDRTSFLILIRIILTLRNIELYWYGIKKIKERHV